MKSPWREPDGRPLCPPDAAPRAHPNMLAEICRFCWQRLRRTQMQLSDAIVKEMTEPTFTAPPPRATHARRRSKPSHQRVRGGYEWRDQLQGYRSQRLGGKIIYQSPNELGETAGSLHPRLLRRGRFEIYLPDFTTARRDRFSIARRIGHYLLHYRCRTSPWSPRASGSNRVEIRANWFAASS